MSRQVTPAHKLLWHKLFCATKAHPPQAGPWLRPRRLEPRVVRPCVPTARFSARLAWPVQRHLPSAGASHSTTTSWSHKLAAPGRSLLSTAQGLNPLLQAVLGTRAVEPRSNFKLTICGSGAKNVKEHAWHVTNTVSSSVVTPTLQDCGSKVLCASLASCTQRTLRMQKSIKSPAFKDPSCKGLRCRLHCPRSSPHLPSAIHRLHRKDVGLLAHREDSRTAELEVDEAC